MDNTDQAILRALARRDGLSTHQIARLIRLSPRAARSRLVALSGPQDPRRQYFLAER